MTAEGVLKWLEGEEESFNVFRMAHLLATASSAAYYTKHMTTAVMLHSLAEVHAFAMSKRPEGGLLLEFGVASGLTINMIAEQSNQAQVYGFDSFDGLPETWRTGFESGRFKNDSLPNVKSNVELVIGKFEDTLPSFLQKHKDHVSYLHVDCDLYSSTSHLLESLIGRILPGTVIVFDEYFNYPGWEHHEYKAFQEFIFATRLTYEYLAIRPKHQQVVIRII